MDVLIIVAQEGYQPVEYADTRSEIEEYGFNVAVASITTSEAVASDGSSVVPDLAVKDANVDDYKAIVLIGGPGAPKLGNFIEVLDLVHSANEKGKIVAAICIAPLVLAKAGVLDGKKATVWNEDGQQSSKLKVAGAEFVDEDVVVDGKLVTGNGPMAAKSFGKKIAELI